MEWGWAALQGGQSFRNLESKAGGADDALKQP